MFHLRFIGRQIASSLKQTLVFVLCVALSLVTLVALGGFGESVNNSLLRDARKLLAGDIIVESSFPFGEPLLAETANLQASGAAETARIYEFISVVRVAEGEETLLSELKVVEPNYPFYGEVGLASGRPFGAVLTSGNVVVAQGLLDRLQLKIGDRLKIGDAVLKIADVVTVEPDNPVDFFELGPRIFISAADLDTINLIKPGSRVRYKLLLKVPDEGKLDDFAERLRAVADEARVNTFRTSQSAVQRFFEQFLIFLNLVGIFTLMLAGIGIQSSLTAFLKEREGTIAILRALGATSSFVMRQYFAVAAVLGLAGVLLGLLLGFVLQAFFPLIFGPFLPPSVELIISPRAILQSLLLGLFVIVAFTFLPIYQIQGLKPYFIFHKESLPFKKGWAYYLIVGLILAFFVAMVLWYLRDRKTSFWFVVGTVALISLTAAITYAILAFLRRSRLAGLAARQALRGLFRPRNATAAIIITLAASLAVLFAIFLIERNLNQNFVAAYPDDAPNLFMLDIQPDQQEAFSAALPVATELFPLIRAQIAAVNGVPIDREAERRRREEGGEGENLARTFNLTYRETLLDNERLITGKALHESADGMAEVSILDELLTARPFQLGDIITFDIQGVLLDARITSIRAVTEDEAIRPRFSFVLRERDLVSAPQTIFTAIHVPESEIAVTQNRLVAQFPNVTVIDVTAAIRTAAALVADINTIVRFFALFSIVAGVLIVISSILATRFARIQEAVYYKVLGARQAFVRRVFTLENLFLGLISATLALLLSQIAAWIIVRWVFELDYQPHLLASLLLVAATMGLVAAVGHLASLSILQKKPIVFLREQSE